MTERKRTISKSVIDTRDGKRLTVEAAAHFRQPFVEIRLRRVDGQVKGESITELTLRQARALRTALDSALAAHDTNADTFARDEAPPLSSDGREPSGEDPRDVSRPAE